ncbi:hypothetical protein [Roseisolibacter sp. H3M3-2]|nr:hypothetical protein [Roseisolibacter sp. H3M3-2]MDF1506440.1 hypothetical protein [Roseisolibacter sp. H3M3-2]
MRTAANAEYIMIGTLVVISAVQQLLALGRWIADLLHICFT